MVNLFRTGFRKKISEVGSAFEKKSRARAEMKVSKLKLTGLKMLVYNRLQRLCVPSRVCSFLYNKTWEFSDSVAQHFIKTERRHRVNYLELNIIWIALDQVPNPV